MIGVIITARITVAVARFGAVQLHDVADRRLARVADQVIVDVRREREDADQPVDDRRHCREQPDHRLEHAPHRRGRELGQEDRREQRDRQRDHHRQHRRDERAPDQRPRAELVDRVTGERRAAPSRGSVRRRHRRDRTSQPVVRERRPRLDEDRDDHRHDQHAAPWANAPSIRSARWSVLTDARRRLPLLGRCGHFASGSRSSSC